MSTGNSAISQERLIIKKEAWAGEQDNFILFYKQTNPGNPVNPISVSASTLICSYILQHYILHIYTHTSMLCRDVWAYLIREHLNIGS